MSKQVAVLLVQLPGAGSLGPSWVGGPFTALPSLHPHQALHVLNCTYSLGSLQTQTWLGWVRRALAPRGGF